MNVFMQFGITLLFSITVSAATYMVVARTHQSNYGFLSSFSLSRWAADRLFCALIVLYTFVFGAISVLQQFAFYGTGSDLASYDQLIWNSLHGRLLENSFIPDAPLYLGKSFSPILLALVPLYAVWANPIVLLVVQTLAVSISVFPIYWTARERLGHGLALVIGLAFFLSPVVQFLNLTQFYEITLAMPLLAFATFFLLRRHYRGFLVCMGLALLVKEEIAFVVITFGLFILLIQRNRAFGLGLAVFGVIWSFMLLQFVIPFFRGSQYGAGFYYFGSGVLGSAQTRYAYLGHSLGEILFTLISRPHIVLQHVVIPDKIEFLLHLFVPLVFVSFFGLEVLAIALPTFGYTLLSDFAFQYSITHAYTPPLIPFVFMSAVVGVERLLNWWNRISSAKPLHRVTLAVLLLAATGITYYMQAPGPLAVNFAPYRYTVTPHTTLGYQLMSMIPDDATVVAQTEFVSSLSDRSRIYGFPAAPDYRVADYLFGDKTRFWYTFHKGSWDYWLGTGYFETVIEQDNYIVAKRKPPEHVLNIRYDNPITLVGYTISLTDTLRGGQKLRPIIEWRANQPISQRYSVAVQVVDAQGHTWASEDREPDDGFSPTDKWQVGESVGDQYSLALPPTMPAGDYMVTIGVHQAGTASYLDAVDATGKPLGNQPVIATVKVEKDKSSYTASDLVKIQPMTAYFVDMGEMRFLGYAPPSPTTVAGTPYSVGIYWRAREKPRGDYVVAVQLRDATGRVAFEQASRPANDTYPTTQWDAGEVLLDWHDFSLPQDIAVGEYQIAVVLRDANDGRVLGETKVSQLTITR